MTPFRTPSLKKARAKALGEKGRDILALTLDLSSMIRIANGQGFWGDWLEWPVRLIEEGPIDDLVAEFTYFRGFNWARRL